MLHFAKEGLVMSFNIYFFSLCKKNLFLLFFLLPFNLFASLSFYDFFKANHSIMLIMDANSGKIIDANRAAQNFYQYSLDEFQQLNIKDINTFSQEQILEELNQAKKQNRNFFIFRHQLKNGEIKTVEVKTTPYVLDNKNVLISIIQDIALERFKQDDILHYQKHLETRIDEQPQPIDNFRNFFANEDEKQRTFIVATVLEDTINIIKNTYDHNFITLIYKINKNIAHFGSENLLSQVILNLLTNAKDALIANNSREKYVYIELFEKNESIYITIQDNAGGIAHEIQDKIFDPYFTTKHQSQGTGLGLYISNQIIETHFKGNIYNENKYLKQQLGSTFTIEFPKVKNI